MRIKAKQNARKWVKERLKRHPGLWRWGLENGKEVSAPCWPGEMVVHIVNIEDGWSGWFPATDIEVMEND